MLTKLKSPLKIIGDYKSIFITSSSLEKGSNNLMEIGLRILVQTSSEVKSNVVVKCSIKKSTSTAMDSCFLKACFLCNKSLSLDKDVYMYRGDKGFCSIECRSRQIYLDEMKEIEESIKNKFNNKSYSSYCSSSGSHETRRLLHDLRRRNNPAAVTVHQNHWAIVS